MPQANPLSQQDIDSYLIGTSADNAKQHPGNASAFADAFLKGCDQPSAWRFKDAATYFDHAWQPAQESCTTNAMFGGASKNSGVVDGSYATCGRPGHALNQALAGGRAPCSVVSVGLNDDTSFEEALRLAAPSCCFRGYDGSLKGVVHGKNRSALAVRLPQFLRAAVQRQSLYSKELGGAQGYVNFLVKN